jgi:hypothetical protein
MLEVKLLIEEACKPKKLLVDEKWEPPVHKKVSPIKVKSPSPQKP